MNTLARQALTGIIKIIILLGLAIFLPAWSFDYWEGWVFLLIFTLSAVSLTVYMFKNDTKLLERRAKGGPFAEKEKTQKVIQLFLSLFYVAQIILPALDHRLGLSDMPLPVVIAGDFLVALGFFFIFLVARENTFLATTIVVAKGQQVITTGPYSLVRHPMYASALIMLIGIPLALGSWWGLLMLIPFSLTLNWRLLDEERFLSVNLKGYSEYCQKTRYRLVPYVW